MHEDQRNPRVDAERGKRRNSWASWTADSNSSTRGTGTTAQVILRTGVSRPFHRPETVSSSWRLPRTSRTSWNVARSPSVVRRRNDRAAPALRSHSQASTSTFHPTREDGFRVVASRETPTKILAPSIAPRRRDRPSIDVPYSEYSLGRVLPPIQYPDREISEYSGGASHLLDLKLGTPRSVIGRAKIVRSGKGPVDPDVEVSIGIDMSRRCHRDHLRNLRSGFIRESTRVRTHLVFRSFDPFVGEIASNRRVRPSHSSWVGTRHMHRVSCVVFHLLRPTSWRSPPRRFAHLCSAAPSVACVERVPALDAETWRFKVRRTSRTGMDEPMGGARRGRKRTLHLARTKTSANVSRSIRSRPRYLARCGEDGDGGLDGFQSKRELRGR